MNKAGKPKCECCLRTVLFENNALRDKCLFRKISDEGVNCSSVSVPANSLVALFLDFLTEFAIEFANLIFHNSPAITVVRVTSEEVLMIFLRWIKL